MADERARPLIERGEKITGARMCEIIGCTMRELEVLRRTGIIKTAGRNSKNWALYGEEAVYTMVDRRKREGKNLPDIPPPDPNYSTEEALAVFKLVKQGMKLEEVMIETSLHPRVLRAILREYELFAGSIYVFKETVDKMNELPLNGSFPITNGEGIFDVMQLAAQEKKCSRCKRRAKSQLCSGCERIKTLKNVSVRESKKLASAVTSVPATGITSSRSRSGRDLTALPSPAVASDEC